LKNFKRDTSTDFFHLIITSESSTDVDRNFELEVKHLLGKNDEV
jgi:hypothetical protein